MGTGGLSLRRRRRPAADVAAAVLAVTGLVAADPPALDERDPRWWIDAARAAADRIDPTAPMASSVHRPSVLGDVSRLYLAVGDFERARAAALRSHDAAARAEPAPGRPLAAIARSQIRAGDVEGARETIGRAVELAGRQRDRARHFADATDALLAWSAEQHARLGDDGRAAELAARIDDRDAALGAWIAVAAAQRDRGALDLAAATLDRIRRRALPEAPARGYQHRDPPSWQVREIMRLYGDVDVAAGLEFAVALEAFDRVAVEALVDHLCARGRIADARWIAATVLGEDTVEHRVVEARLNAGDLHGAMEAARRIGDPRTGGRVLEQVVKAHLAEADVEAARLAAGRIDDFAILAAVVARIAEAAPDRATSTWVREQLRRIPEGPDDWTRLDIVRGLCAAGDFEAAARVRTGIRGPDHRDWAELIAIEAMAASGDLDAAEGAAANLADGRDRDDQLLKIAAARAAAGDAAGAGRVAGRISDAAARVEGLAAVIRAHLAAGAVGEARAVAGAAVGLAAAGGEATRHVGLAQSAGGDLDGAEATAMACVIDWARDEVLADVIARRAAAGDVAAASATLERSLALPRGAGAGAQTLAAAFAAGCARGGHLDEARAALGTLDDPLLASRFCVAVADALLSARAEPTRIAIESGARP